MDSPRADGCEEVATVELAPQLLRVEEELEGCRFTATSRRLLSLARRDRSID
jgi:hypothetical protein